MAEIAAVFRNAPPQRATYTRALEIIQRVVAFKGAALYLIGENRRRVVEVATYGSGFNPQPYGDVDDFMSWLAHQHKTVSLSDLDQFCQLVGKLEKSVLIVPLLVEDNLIGSVVYNADGPQAFRDKDIKLLAVIGDQIALSIERLIYQRELERKNAELHYAQKQLKEAHKKIILDETLTAVKQLAVSINHEINNPLSVITGNVEYLLYINKNLSDSITERLKIIESEALRIAEINRKLLDIQSLVSESYIHNDDNVHMLNLDKSSSGKSND
jgi:signal transduction histidine kinase